MFGSITKLPIVLKGILTAEDAIMGVEMGAAAILVSNHGARQVDYVPAGVCIIFKKVLFHNFIMRDKTIF